MQIQDVDQFFRAEIGTGAVVLNDRTSPIAAGFAMLVPAGITHNFMNIGTVPLN